MNCLSMKTDWKETTLGKEVVFQRGFDLPATERKEGRFPLFTASGQDGFHSEYKVKGPGIVTGRSGTLGQVFFIEDDFWPLNTTLWVKDFRGNDKKFFYYLLKTLKLERYNAGSGVPTLNRNHLDHYPLRLPSVDDQHAIAAVLSSLDDKIELLHKQNETLERLAVTLFHEWFIRPTTSAHFPEGWRIYRLGELADVISGYAYKGTDLVESSSVGMVNLKNFERNGGFRVDGLKPIKGEPKASQEVKIGDVVVAHTDLTQDAEVLGNTAIISDAGSYERLYISMDVAKVEPKLKISRAFLYFLMRTHSFKQYCIGYANGTTVLHLPRTAVSVYEVGLPIDLGNETVREFDALAASVTQKITANIRRVRTLTATRDTLLPRLMSGEIRV